MFFIVIFYYFLSLSLSDIFSCMFRPSMFYVFVYFFFLLLWTMCLK